MKSLAATVPLALALALSVSACSKGDSGANVAASNEAVLNDEGALDANLSDNVLPAEEGSLDNATLDNATVGNDAGVANGL